MAAEDFQPIQGMSDLGPPEISDWRALESKAREILALYGYEEVRTPILERTSVFVRSLGDTTDVVQKEMYTFEDRGGRQLSLRPEGTAGVIRYVASRGQDAQDARLFYWGPMFRAERPQAGRRRQFHQLGAECIGAPNAAADAETIALQRHVLTAWGLKDFKFQVNTRGLPEDRKAVQQGMIEALTPHVNELCDDCRRRLTTNVLRVLDCKQDGCRAIVEGLPPLTKFMAPASRQYLDDVLGILHGLGIEIVQNPRLVRGLDYYVHTVWEITHPALGAQDALSGGGRYVITFGDKTIEGVGFAMGIERVLTARGKDAGPAADAGRRRMVWLVSMGDRAFDENLKLAQSLRMRGVACGMDLARRSMKAQMRAADRSGASHVAIRGDAEMEKGTFMLKDMAAGTQSEVAMPELMQQLLGKIPPS